MKLIIDQPAVWRRHRGRRRALAAQADGIVVNTGMRERSTRHHLEHEARCEAALVHPASVELRISNVLLGTLDEAQRRALVLRVIWGGGDWLIVVDGLEHLAIRVDREMKDYQTRFAQAN